MHDRSYHVRPRTPDRARFHVYWLQLQLYLGAVGIIVFECREKIIYEHSGSFIYRYNKKNKEKCASARATTHQESPTTTTNIQHSDTNANTILPTRAVPHTSAARRNRYAGLGYTCQDPHSVAAPHVIVSARRSRK